MLNLSRNYASCILFRHLVVNQEAFESKVCEHNGIFKNIWSKK